GNSPWSVATGDLNNDGHPDIAVATQTGGGGISVLMNNGDGTFSPTGNHVTTPDSTSGVVIADLNADGHADVAYANSSTGVGVLLNNGDGTLGVAHLYSVGASGLFDIAAGDVNGDGIVDLATANFSSLSASVLLGE